jgi:hypothetical protein
MKKIILISLILVSFLTAKSQSEFEFRGSKINSSILFIKCGATLSDAVINNATSLTGSAVITSVFIQKFGQTAFLEILQGNIAGKDTNIVRMMFILMSSDLDAKTKLQANLLYQKQKTAGLSLETLANNHTVVTGYWQFEKEVKGFLIAVNKQNETAIIDSDGNLFSVNYYSVK